MVRVKKGVWIMKAAVKKPEQATQKPVEKPRYTAYHAKNRGKTVPKRKTIVD